MKNLNNIILLIAGAVFFFFSNGRYYFALAAWIYPICFLMLSRNPKVKYIYLILPFTTAILSQFAFWKFTFQRTNHFLFYLPFILGLFYGLMFYIDRIVYPKIQGFTSTLFLPCLYTSFDFLLNIFNPFGTTGVLGYSQIEFLSFSQLASITGMWGLTFMIIWFGSVVQWSIQKKGDSNQIRHGILIYCSIFTSIILYGIVRLSIPSTTKTVKIAGLHSFDKEDDGKIFWKSLAQKEYNKIKSISQEHLNKLIKNTRREAAKGAKIIIWSESTHNILKEVEDSTNIILSNLANELNIYLLTNPYTATTDKSKPENKVLFYDPTGKIILKHYKYGGSFMEGSIEGDKKIQCVDSQYGKLSTLICWDADFPSIVKQVGEQKADILLIPASDWLQIDPLHTTVAVFRGIENGCSVVRQTRNGLSIMTDPFGRTISKLDHFETKDWTNVGNVPINRQITVYPILSDWFGWLSMLITLLLLNQALFFYRRIDFYIIRKIKKQEHSSI